MKNYGSEEYIVNGWSIWSPDEKTWIAEPPFTSDKAIQNFKNSQYCKSFKTINAVKKWVKENGHIFSERDFAHNSYYYEKAYRILGKAISTKHYDIIRKLAYLCCEGQRLGYVEQPE